jgi:16S rRNA (cytidine1402-2'-O)-methyltransferase
VSDPGARLVRAVREAGFGVVPVPGPSAVVAAVSAAGLYAERFAFLGFLPTATKARRELLASVASLPLALVLFEAPHRVRATAAELAGILAGSRTLIVARELTKLFETMARMTLGEADAWFAADPNRERGEFVLIVDAPAQDRAAAPLTPEIERLLSMLLDELPPARVARVIAQWLGMPREAVYSAAVALAKGKLS